MPRRGENIYKRKDGRWEGRYIKLRLPDGKAKYGYIYADSYKAVKTKLKVATHTVCMFDNSNKTTGEYSVLLFKWLQAKRITVKESTLSRYHFIVGTYIIPKLGSINIADISMTTIENFTHELLVAGKKNGESGLSPKTVSDILAVVKSTFEYGRENNYRINCNLKSISIKKKERNMRVLTPFEQSKLMAVLLDKTDLYKFGVLLSLYTGMRIGELCALRWENIQNDTNTIKIRDTLQRISTADECMKTRIIITTPKSASSFRDIPLPNCLLPIITQFRANPNMYVLTGDKNRYTEPRTMQYHFHQYTKEAGILAANFHSLRHTFATRCVEMGFEIKSLSEILGHSSVNITLNEYVHSSFDLKAQNMNKLTL